MFRTSGSIKNIRPLTWESSRRVAKRSDRLCSRRWEPVCRWFAPIAPQCPRFSAMAANISIPKSRQRSRPLSSVTSIPQIYGLVEPSARLNWLGPTTGIAVPPKHSNSWQKPRRARSPRLAPNANRLRIIAMRILIFGGTGMLGHQLWRHFASEHEVTVTVRRSVDHLIDESLRRHTRQLLLNEAADFGACARIVRETRPEVVLNCVGVIKQRLENKDHILNLMLNSLLPHHLARICGDNGARLVLFSTDCIFSGNRGDYAEDDSSDATDLYGRTKYLGEVTALKHVVTVRSSIIGRELESCRSLVDWFLSQNGSTVKGYRRAIYSGFTTNEMARIVERILATRPALDGLWQVASRPISKFDLLGLVKDAFGLRIKIEPDDEFLCDRSLDGSRFCALTGYSPPAWESMIAELALTGKSQHY
jgi:dTDP-4-dehydrorhamnose reductase